MGFDKKEFLNTKKNSYYNISKQIFYDHHNHNFSPSFGQFLSSCFLTLLSLIGILVSKFKHLNKAHYYIIPNKSKHPFIDNRSQEIIKIIGRKKIFNLVKSVNNINSIKFFCSYPNTIFFYSILDIILFFNYKYSNDVKKNCKSFHFCNKKFKMFIKKLFKFLDIQKFIMIDDHRWASMFQQICKELEITSIGYMHGKFHKNQIGSRLSTFDYYILWDYFFKKQLLSINKSYNLKKILYNFHPGLKKKIKVKNKKINKKEKINILYVYEENVDFKKIYPILKDMLKEKIAIDIKLRKNSFINEELIAFSIKNKIKLIDENNLQKIFLNNYDFLLAHNSTMLYEALFFNVIPIRIMLKTIKIEDQISDNFFIKITSNLKNYYKFFSKLKKNYKSSKFKKLIWNYHLYKFPKHNAQIVRELLNN